MTINNIIEENAIRGNITTDVMHNENNNAIIIYFGSISGYYYIITAENIFHSVHVTHENAIKTAINCGYHH